MADLQPACSAPYHLRRIEAPDDFRRCYMLSLWAVLLGGTILAWEWSWVGRDGAVMRQHFAECVSAEQELDQLAKNKIRRGDRPVDQRDRRAAPSETFPVDVASLVPRHLYGSL